jgi:hypothetical protein
LTEERPDVDGIPFEETLAELESFGRGFEG